MTRLERHDPSRRIWPVAWTVAVVLAVLGLAFPVYVLGRLWLSESTWLAITFPLVIAPLVVVLLTASGRPGRRAGVAALAASVAVLALGVAMQRLLAWVVALDGSWYHGPGGYDESDFPWRTFETMALVYAGGGALLLALVAVALVRRHRRAQVTAPRLGQRVGREDVGSA